MAVDAPAGRGFGGDAHTPATRELASVGQGTLTLTVAGERYGGTVPVTLTMIVLVPPAPE